MAWWNPFDDDSVWQRGWKTITGAFDNVLREVGNVVSKVGSTFSAVVGNILDNPIPTIASIALTSVGVPPQVVSLVRTAAQGGDMEDMILNVAASYAGGQIGQQIGGALDPTSGLDFGDLYVPDISQELMTNLITNASGSAATALLQGKKFDEILEAGVTGVIASKFTSALRTELDIDPKSFSGDLFNKAVSGATQAILAGADPATVISRSLVGTTIGAGMQGLAQGVKSTINEIKTAANEYNDTKQDVDSLQASLSDEYNKLVNYEPLANQLISEYNNLKDDLFGARDSISFINQAITDANSGNYYDAIRADSAFEKAIAAAGYVRTKPDFIYNPASGSFEKNFEYQFVKQEDMTSSGPRPGAEIVTIKPPVPPGASFFGSDLQGDSGESLLNFAKMQVNLLDKYVDQLDVGTEGSLADQAQDTVEKFNETKTNYEANKNKLTGLVSDLYGPEYSNWLASRDAYREKYIADKADQYRRQWGSYNTKESIDRDIEFFSNSWGRDANYNYDSRNPSPGPSGLAGELEDLLSTRDAQLQELDGFIAQYIDSAANLGIELSTDIVNKAIQIVDENVYTEQEIQNEFAKRGYQPTPAEIAQFIGEGSPEKLDENVEKYVEENVVTPEEVLRAFRSMGYNPTEDELNPFVGQRSEKQALDEIANVVYQDQAERVKQRPLSPDQLSTYEDFVGPMARDLEEDFGLPSPAGEIKVDDYTDTLGNLGDGIDFFSPQDQEDIQRAFADMQQPYVANLNEALSGITQRVNEYEAYGATRDEAMSAAIDDVADTLGQTRQEFLDRLGETQSSLANRVAESEAAFAGQLGDLQDNLISRITAFENAGLSRETAIKNSISELADELGDTEAGLLQKLGTTEQQLQAQIGGVEERLGSQLGALGQQYEAKLSTAVSDITDRMNEYEAYGATRDEALQAAIDNVASGLGLAKEDFLTQLGETETSLGSRIAESEQAFAQQLGTLQTDLVDRIGAFERAGLSRDEAIKQSISELAGELGDTEEGLLQKLGTTEQQLQTQIGGVEERLGAQIGALGREYETKLSTAVGDITDRMNEFEAYGATRDEALQAAIDNVAEQMGLNSQELLDQLSVSQQELQNQIEAAELEYARQVVGLTEDIGGLGTEITGVKTGLETLGKTVGEQVGGLGTQVTGLGAKVTGIEQALAKQPELWANLIAGLQKGFGTQIGGLQSQLTAQQKAQQAQAAQQQAAMMAPKFEAFYANIPGYKPFDVRQFSSDFYDEE